MLDPRSNGSSRFGDHERWVEMCALLTADTLSRDELQQLNAHLETCAECRRAAADFQEISRISPSFLIGDNPPRIEESVEWPEEKFKKRLFAALDEQEQHRSIDHFPAPIRHSNTFRYLTLFLIAAAIGVSAYFFGARRHASRPAETARIGSSANDVLSSQLAFARNQRDALLVKEHEEAERIQDLSTQVAEQTKSLTRLKQELEKAQAADGEQQTKISKLQDENAALKTAQEQDARRLQDSQSAAASLRDELSRLQREHTTDLMQSAAMQKTIDELSAQVRSTDAVLSEQKRFLDSDRDIRELMGARDLYVADVFDIGPDGSSRKPFGRVFYTKNKSLVFYAFDLDKQPNLRDAATFQAWGQNSLDKDRPINMGIFYMDNQANRRWVLKFDNP